MRGRNGTSGPSRIGAGRPKRPIIAPSIICANFAELGNEVRQLEEAGADWLHFDVMDGQFVPNLTIGALVLESLRGLTELHFDVHLMVYRPDHLIEAFVISGANLITVHAEACPHLMRTLQLIRSFEVEAGVALNPATPVSTIQHVLGEVGLVNVMTVNPGFAGQRFIEAMLPKIEEMRRLIDREQASVLLQVDGGINPETAPRALAAGADVFVAGASIFYSEGGIHENLLRLRRSLEEATV